MKKLLFPLLAICLIGTGCDEELKEPELIELGMGMYIELNPIIDVPAATTKINFIDKERLIIFKGTKPSSDEFKYEINGHTIKLVHIVEGVGSSQYYFRVITSRKFEIGWLHHTSMDGITIPPIMTFIKE